MLKKLRADGGSSSASAEAIASVTTPRNREPGPRPASQDLKPQTEQSLLRQAQLLEKDDDEDQDQEADEEA
jgi:hypothetical protein